LDGLKDCISGFAEKGEGERKRKQTLQAVTRAMSSDRWSSGWSEISHLLSTPSSEAVAQVVISEFLQAQVTACEDEEISLRNLVQKVQAGYNSTPYHNFVHATHVFLGTVILLQNSTIAWSRVEKAALIFTAIVHDLGHQGVPNVQLVKENDPLAVKFENISVAENHSYEAAMALLERDGCQIFANFTTEEMDLFRSLSKSILLCTDIADGAAIKRLYAGVADMVAAGGALADADTKFDTTDQGNRTRVLCLLMKLADVGAPLQELSTALCWAHQFFYENSAAYANGRGNEIDFNAFQVGQIGFFDHYLFHVIEVAASTGALVPAVTNAMTENLSTYKEYWISNAGREGGLLQTWSAEFAAKQTSAKVE